MTNVSIGRALAPGGGLVLIVAILMVHLGASPALGMVASSWSPQTAAPPSPTLNAPSIRVSMASSRGINALYAPRDPKTIPAGFQRMCLKAGGFAPRPVWDEITNGVTPWFESKDGCFVYFNCNDARWYVDNAYGAGMYLANPAGSLLLPPTHGWASLTGRRVGAPKISFV